MNPLIFLSYSSKDKLVADAICSRLENQGIRCWIAPRDVKPGSDYSNQIADALESSTTMVMVFSSDSNTSRHVKSEIDRAFSLGKIIIPFRVENVELDKGLAYYLAKTHWLDAVTKPLEQHIDRLATTIRQVSGTEAPTSSQERSFAAPAPVAPPNQNKTLWFVVGIVGVCALVAGIGLLFLWLNQSKSGTRQTATPAAENSPGPATSTLSRSPAPSASFFPSQADSSAVNPPDQNQFEGMWTIAEAETLDGIPYAGTVQITKRGGRYEVTWRSSASNASGIGLAAGKKLCVAWSPNECGVLFYKVGQDGTLKGRWTGSATPFDTSEGLENASGGSGKIEGEYVVKGTNPGGREYYQGKLEITKTGETYQLQWNVAGRLTKGVGIKVDDGFFVAWGNKEPFGVISYSFDGAQVKGVWTLAGATKTATESLAK